MAMDVIHKKALQQSIVFICDNIILDGIWSHLIVKEIFTESMVDLIKAAGTRHDQAFKLVLDIQRRGDSAFDAFCDILDNTRQKFIADELRKKNLELRGHPPSFLGASGLVNLSTSGNQNGQNMGATFGGHTAHPGGDVGHYTQPVHGSNFQASSASGLVTQPSDVTDIEITQGYMGLRVQSTSSNRDSADAVDAYVIRSNPAGYALIINNIDFTNGLKRRNGSSVDTENLKSILLQLGYNVCVKTNLIGKEMTNVVQQFSRMDKHRAVDSCVVAILSHGLDGEIYGTDGDLVPLDLLIHYFNGDNCENLQTKPKVFIIQACRGEKFDTGFDCPDAALSRDVLNRLQQLSLNENAQQLQRLTRHPTESDMLIAYATVPGYVSWRNSERGSWFIQALCQVISENAHREDALSMLTMVNNRVARAYGSNFKQVPQPVFTLRKKLFFNVKPA